MRSYDYFIDDDWSDWFYSNNVDTFYEILQNVIYYKKECRPT